MKTGANMNDVNDIEQLYEEGLSAEEISEKLRIELSCVASFAPKGTKGAKKKAGGDEIFEG